MMTFGNESDDDNSSLNQSDGNDHSVNEDTGGKTFVVPAANQADGETDTEDEDMGGDQDYAGDNGAVDAYGHSGFGGPSGGFRMKLGMYGSDSDDDDDDDNNDDGGNGGGGSDEKSDGNDNNEHDSDVDGGDGGDEEPMEADDQELTRIKLECSAMLALLKKLEREERNLATEVEILAREAVRCGFVRGAVEAPAPKRRKSSAGKKKPEAPTKARQKKD